MPNLPIVILVGLDRKMETHFYSRLVRVSACGLRLKGNPGLWPFGFGPGLPANPPLCHEILASPEKSLCVSQEAGLILQN